MKKLLILLFSILISFNSYGEWTQLMDWENGDSSYIDYDTIIENDGYIYWWELKNMNAEGYKSVMTYWQGDCKINRAKMLSTRAFKELLGQGDSNSWGADEWFYPSPDTYVYDMLNYVCDYVD